MKNTEVNNGLEAWRGLNATYDSNNKGRERVRIQFLLQPKRALSVLQKTETVERWKCDTRECEQRFGKTLDEDVEVGVILALVPSQEQNHSHLNSHILKIYAQVRTVLFDYCRAQAETASGDVVPMDLSMLGKGKGEKGKGEKKGKGKGNANAKTAKLDAVLSARPGGMRRRIAGGMRTLRAGRTPRPWRRRSRQLRTPRPNHRSLGC